MNTHTHTDIDADDLDARIEAEAARIYEEIFVYESTETASWAAALEHQLTARIEACRSQAVANIVTGAKP